MAKTNIWIDGNQAGATLRTLQKEVNKLNREIKDLPRNSDEYRKKTAELKTANAAIAEHRNQVKGIAGAFGQARMGIKSMLSQFAPMALAFSGLSAGISMIVNGISQGIRGIIQFDTALADLSAVTGANATQMAFFEQKSIEFSKRFGESAADIATAFKLAGSARPELLKNGQAMADLTEKAIILSKASGDDVPTSIANLTATLNAFDKPATKAGETMDILANASQLGVQEIPYLTEAMGKFGGVADKANVSIATSAASLEILGKKIKEPSTAGTNMRGVLIKMQVAAEESGRKFAGFTQELDLLGDKVNDVTYLKKVYGEENLLAIQTLIAEREEIKRLEKAYGKQGTAKKMAEKNSATLGEAIERLTASFMAEFVEMRDGASGLTSAIDWLSKNIGTVIGWVGKAIKYFIIWKTTLLAGKAVSFLFNGGLKELASNFLKVGDASKNAGGGVKGMASALKGAGWGAVMALITEVATAIYKVASGAMMVEFRMKSIQKAQESGTKKGSKYTATVIKGYEDELKAIEELEAGRKISAKEAIEQRKKVTKAAEDELKSKIKLLSSQRDEIKEERKAAKVKSDALKAKHSYITSSLEETKVNGFAEKKWVDLLSAEKEYNSAIIELKGGLDQLSESQHQNTVAGLEQAHQTKEQSKAADDARKHYQDLRDELQKLIDTTDELQRGVEFEQRLNQYEDGLNKELFVLQDNIQKKYAAEIEMARKLMAEKGDIGVKAAEQYNRLLQLEDKDYEEQKKLLEEKYLKESKEKQYEIEKDANLQSIEQQRSLEDAIIEIKVAKAQAAVNAVAETDIEGKRKANEALRAVLEEQLAHEKKRKLEALLDEYDQGAINSEELHLRKEELEAEHLERINELHKQSNEELAAMDLARIEKLQNAMATAFEFVDKVIQIQNNKEKKRNSDRNKKELAALDEQLASKQITQEQYDAKKKEIEDANDARVADQSRKQFEREKAFNIAKIAIETAVAVAKALATGVPPMNFINAGIALALGTAQGVIAANQTAPQFKDGGYANVVGAQDGKKYKAKYAGRLKGGMTPQNASLALISEKGPEYFVPHHLMQNQVVANHVSAIEAIRTNQFAAGGYTTGSGGGSDNDIIAMLQANTAVMQALSDQIPNMAVNINQKNIDKIQRETGRLNKNRA